MSVDAIQDSVMVKFEDELDLSDIPEITEEMFRNAELVIPQRKRAITIRLDEDIIEFFKAFGGGYQTRMNAVLRAFVREYKQRE
jgi:uncharacterized protein (DUF4415 family)